MATSLKLSGKEGRIDHLQFNTYHMLQRLWKSVQRIPTYFGSERTSPVRHKIGCRGNIPWGIWKTGADQENSRKYLPFGEKIVKIGPVDTKIALLQVKKKKLQKVKYIALLASLPCGLNKTKYYNGIWCICQLNFLQTCKFSDKMYIITEIMN